MSRVTSQVASFFVVCLLCSSWLFGVDHEPVHIGEPPPWVDRFENPDLVELDLEGSKGTAYLIIHRQWMMKDEFHQRTSHFARKVIDIAGLQQLTQIDVDFDPNYESLMFHFIRLRRDGEVLDRLDQSQIRLIQREDELERQIYDETLSAVVFLEDVRVGDTVEYAYTLTGSNPVFDGHFTAHLSTGFFVRVGTLTYRILVRDQRAINIKNHRAKVAVRQSSSDAGREYEWNISPVEAIEYEDDTPGWYQQYPWIQVTDFESWSDVVGWALPLYSVPVTRGTMLQDAVTACDAFEDRNERVLCAVRFVQDDIRYLGLEIGPNSHRPHDPQDVLRQRYGDCKDKSLLLILLLDELGVNSVPALVNTGDGRGVEEWLPSPNAFNHVIVRLDVAGDPVYVDATHSLQGGELESMIQPDYERALLITEGVGVFEEIAAQKDRSGYETSEQFVVDSDGRADFTVTTVWTGEQADWQRSLLAERPTSEITVGYLNFYDEIFPEIESTNEFLVQDDRSANRVTIVEKYRIPSFWDSGRRTLRGSAIRDIGLQEPDVRLRRHPLEIEHPLDVRHSIEVELPFRPNMNPETEVIENDVFMFRSQRRVSGSSVVADYSFQTRLDWIPAENVKGHLNALDRVHRSLGFTVVDRAENMNSKAIADPSLRWILYSVLSVGGVVVVWEGVKRGRKAVRRARYRNKARIRVGESPRQPLEVASEDKAISVLERPPCACSVDGGEPDLIRDELIVGGRSMFVVAYRCSGCGAETRLYFTLK